MRRVLEAHDRSRSRGPAQGVAALRSVGLGQAEGIANLPSVRYRSYIAEPYNSRATGSESCEDTAGYRNANSGRTVIDLTVHHAFD